MASEHLTIDSLLQQVIDALTANDAARLADLQRTIGRVDTSQWRDQWLRAASRRHLLAAVLNETAGNLRLLQRATGRGGEPRAGYGRLHGMGNQNSNGNQKELQQWPH